ncbi:cyclic nucleotide-binding domain-containing protein [Alcanivorax sp.]|uniref:cyclic nucleotide-binding domain-containing protein n=1 Tax=Alcanivorax sp. TaxID=1872427 RepID=UPI003BA9F014
MEQANNNDFGQQRTRQLLSGVPFFNEIARDDQHEFAHLERNTRLWVAGSGDTVIRAGDVDSTLYFLLRGQLEVLSEHAGDTPLYYVSPGEVFGTLSMLLGTPRSATIKVAENAREAVLASLDFNQFNEDDGPYSLATRLAFFHMIVHHIRWTLEVKRMQSPITSWSSPCANSRCFTARKAAGKNWRPSRFRPRGWRSCYVAGTRKGRKGQGRCS